MNGLLCPRCEKPLSKHHEGECPRHHVSRRFFLGFLGTAFGAAAAASVLPNVELDAPQGDGILVTATPKIHSGATITAEHWGNWYWMGTSSDPRARAMCEDAKQIAARRHRSVIVRNNGQVVCHVDFDKNGKMVVTEYPTEGDRLL